MLELDETALCVGKAIDYLRQSQDDQGRWLAGNRGVDAPFYALGLVLDNESPDSAVIKDLCDYFESCVTAEGGFAPHPGEPAHGFYTSLLVSFFKWAKPSSHALARAQTYLKKTGQNYRDPLNLMARSICVKEERESVLSDKGPHSLLRELGLWISRTHASERVDLEKTYPRRTLPLSWMERFVVPELVRWLTFPPILKLDEAAARAPGLTGFDMQLLVCAALMRLAGDCSDDARKLHEFAKKRRERFIFDDGSYEWITLVVADLFFTTVFELDSERRTASKALRAVRYLGDGWISGESMTAHIFDTALTLNALAKLQIPKSDPLVAKTVDYLTAAPSKEGMWAWSYSKGMGDKRAYADTDDTGAAMMALAAYGECPDSSLFQKARHGLLDMQESSGAFSTFGDTFRPNWCWVSNSARALQGLVISGLSQDDKNVRRGLEWLLSKQLVDGSWIDGWGARYIYGTVTVMEGLLLTGYLRPTDAQILKAKAWLLKEVNDDGGWGETWSGERTTSTCEHTGLAVYGLCLTAPSDTPSVEAIKSGLNWLVRNQNPDGSWKSSYFINFGYGSGMADTQIPIIWALHALSGTSLLASRATRG